MLHTQTGQLHVLQYFAAIAVQVKMISELFTVYVCTNNNT